RSVRPPGPRRVYSLAYLRRRPTLSVLLRILLRPPCPTLFPYTTLFRSLFRLQLNPHTPANTLTAETHQAIWHDQVQLLEIGVATGRIITTDAEHRPGVELNEAWPDHANYVYQRQGKSCLVCCANATIAEA